MKFVKNEVSTAAAVIEVHVTRILCEFVLTMEKNEVPTAATVLDVRGPSRILCEIVLTMEKNT